MTGRAVVRQRRLGPAASRLVTALSAWGLVACLWQQTEARAQQGGSGFLFREPVVSFNFRFGFDHALTGSDLFTFVTANHTVDRRDFSSIAVAVDVGIRLTSRLDLLLGTAYAHASTPSEFRNFVDNNNQPIEQVTVFRRTPVSASLKAYLLPRGHLLGRFAWVPARYAPFVGLGGGVIAYRFSQSGDFIDFSTMQVFSDRFTSSGVVPSAHLFGGLDVALGPHVALTSEARYTWARASLDGDYVGFERLDLSGLSATAGLSFRF